MLYVCLGFWFVVIIQAPTEASFVLAKRRAGAFAALLFIS